MGNVFQMKRRFGCLLAALAALLLACGSAGAWSSASSDPSCDGSTIVLELDEQAATPAFSSASKKVRPRAFYALPSPFGPWPAPANASSARPARLLVAEPIDACKDLVSVVAAGGNSSSSSSSSSSFVLLVARGGGCSFLEKVTRAREAGAEGVVVFNAGDRGCVYLGVGGNSSSAAAGAPGPSREELEALPLTVSVDAATGARLLAAASDASSSSSSSPSSSASAAAGTTAAALLRIYEPVPSGVVDGSALVLGSLAVSGLVIGALVASRDEVKRRTRTRSKRRRTLEGAAASASASAEGEEEREERDEEGEEPLAFSSFSDVAFVVALMASALLAAFFLPKVFSFLLAALFVFGATEATAAAAGLLLARAFPWMRATEVALPSFPAPWGRAAAAAPSVGGEREGGEPEGGEAGSREEEEEEDEEAEEAPAPAAPPKPTAVRASTLAGLLVALPLAAAWLLRGPRRVWPLHDLLALALVSSIPAGLRLPSLGSCCALLLLAACNDVFFVFVQPLLTHSSSVMVAVATATPALVLLSPLQRGGPSAGFALLGFGDVVVPGACVAFAARWDALRRLERDGEEARSGGASSSSPPPSLPARCRRRFSSPLLWAPVAGYALGLCLTYLALSRGLGSSAGQPALLYLSPSVLLATAAALLARGGGAELRAAWRGLDSKGIEGGSSSSSSSRRRPRGGSDSESSALLAA